MSRPPADRMLETRDVPLSVLTAAVEVNEVLINLYDGGYPTSSGYPVGIDGAGPTSTYVTVINAGGV